MAEKDYHILPAILKHTTMAIFGKLSGTQEARMLNAYNIARAKLSQAGYLTPGSIEGPPEAVGLTPQGVERNERHKREHKARSDSFDSMAWILDQAQIAEHTVGNKPPTGTPPEAYMAVKAMEELASKRKPIKRVPDHTPPPGSKQLAAKVDRVKSASKSRLKRHLVKRARKA